MSSEITTIYNVWIDEPQGEPQGPLFYKTGECCSCGSQITYCEATVPHVKIENIVHPICLECMTKVNDMRAAMGEEMYYIIVTSYMIPPTQEEFDSAKARGVVQ